MENEFFTQRLLKAALVCIIRLGRSQYQIHKQGCQVSCISCDNHIFDGLSNLPASAKYFISVRGAKGSAFILSTLLPCIHLWYKTLQLCKWKQQNYLFFEGRPWVSRIHNVSLSVNKSI